MSSRNAYLDPKQRKRALVLSRSLARVEQEFKRGQRSAALLIGAGRKAFAEEPSVRIDYFSILDPDSLEPVEDVSSGTLVAVAAFFDSTRLIDNIVLTA
jgi:pantoate--beta-alanine ligase